LLIVISLHCFRYTNHVVSNGNGDDCSVLSDFVSGTDLNGMRKTKICEWQWAWPAIPHKSDKL